VLKHIVELFRTRLRKDDLLARYAGDEFVVLFPNVDLHSAKKAAETLRKIVVENPYQTATGIKIPITLSMGVSEHMEENVCEELLQNADKALYLAKELGRNRVEVYSGK